MDWQQMINIAMATVLGVTGWFARQIWDSVQRLKDDLNRLEVELPTNYVRKSEIDIRFDKIEGILNKIFDKLESKADK